MLDMSDIPSAPDEFLIDPTVSPNEVDRAPLRFSEALARTINTSEDRELPMVFAYIDENSAIRQTFRGSIHVHGSQQLSFWNRDPNGGFIRAMKAGHDFVCTTYRERDTPRVLQFQGRARLVEDSNEAARVWSESPELERKLTHGRNGVAVIIELDRIQGIDQSAQTGEWKPFEMTREFDQ